MKDNTYYFDHDYNAQNDPKVEKMIFSFDSKGEDGNSAYGVFWRIIEKLAQEPMHKLKTEYEILAYYFRKKVEFIKSVVEDFGLFVIHQGWFWSQRLNDHFEKRKILAERGRKGGAKKAENYKLKYSQFVAQAELSSSQTLAQVELSSTIKEKKSKENINIKSPINISLGEIEPQKQKKFLKPDVSEIQSFCEKNNLNLVNYQRFYNYYEANGWKIGKNSMKSWQATLRNWQINQESEGLGDKNGKSNTKLLTRSEKADFALNKANSDYLKNQPEIEEIGDFVKNNTKIEENTKSLEFD